MSVDFGPGNSILDRLIESGAEESRPIRAIFELTYRCNLGCSFCYCIGREGAELGLDEVCRTIDGLQSEGCMFLTLSGGEILCREDFPEIARHARGRGLALELKTNGTLVDADASKLIAGLYPFNVDVSIHAADAEGHDRVTRVPGSFDGALNGVRLLREEGVPVTLKSLLTRENYADYERIRALAQELGADCLTDITVSASQDGGCSAHAHRLRDGQLADFMERNRADMLDLLAETLAAEDFREAADCHQCNAGLTTCCISPYGDVYPCVQFLRAVGNIREKDFPAIWRGSEELSRIRDIRLRDLAVCGSCELLPYCFRCPGLADLEDGDMLGPSSEACRQARACRDMCEKRG